MAVWARSAPTGLLHPGVLLEVDELNPRLLFDPAEASGTVSGRKTYPTSAGARVRFLGDGLRTAGADPPG